MEVLVTGYIIIITGCFLAFVWAKIKPHYKLASKILGIIALLSISIGIIIFVVGIFIWLP